MKEKTTENKRILHEHFYVSAKELEIIEKVCSELFLNKSELYRLALHEYIRRAEKESNK